MTFKFSESIRVFSLAAAIPHHTPCLLSRYPPSHSLTSLSLSSIPPRPGMITPLVFSLAIMIPHHNPQASSCRLATPGPARRRRVQVSLSTGKPDSEGQDSCPGTSLRAEVGREHHFRVSHDASAGPGPGQAKSEALKARAGIRVSIDSDGGYSQNHDDSPSRPGPGAGE